MNGVTFRGSGGLLQKIFTGILILLLAAFWVIALAGTAATQSSCVKLKPTTGRRLMEAQPEGFSLDEPLFMGRQILSERRLLASSDEKYCNNLVKFLWWGVWFEFLCLVLAIVCAVIPSVMDNMGNTSTVFFIMCTVVLMIVADAFNDYIYTYDKDYTDSRYNDLKSGLQAGMAGVVGLLVLNFLYLIGMTFGENYSYSSHAAPAAVAQPGHELKTTHSSPEHPAYPPQSTPSYGQPAPYSPNAQPYAPGPGPQGYSAQGPPPQMQPYSPPNPYYVQQGPSGAAPPAGGPPPS